MKEKQKLKRKWPRIFQTERKLSAQGFKKLSIHQARERVKVTEVYHSKNAKNQRQD